MESTYIALIETNQTINPEFFHLPFYFSDVRITVDMDRWIEVDFNNAVIGIGGFFL